MRSLPNFKSLLVPFGGFSEASDRSKARLETSWAACEKASAGPGRRVANVSASPAARLRNYLASKARKGFRNRRVTGDPQAVDGWREPESRLSFRKLDRWSTKAREHRESRPEPSES